MVSWHGLPLSGQEYGNFQRLSFLEHEHIPTFSNTEGIQLARPDRSARTIEVSAITPARYAGESSSKLPHNAAMFIYVAPLFPTRHRPYLALEQFIGEIALQFAEKLTKNYPSGVQEKWSAATKELCFPD
ncbi:hypothetical protein BOTBODRAFT_297416 [Botryobasidium botryosum FD-172 SS1]|uniref:Uncharacterized protein n=1 Tax=Botryobasidium botryosum (strain FD-172 SS1) TaxID=930990 RepID=A0A067MTW8_BOTB1|nr:hypothetical protein BOTBODRAFT_297416 [Botryobasidium botryosum FD-172 SS1]